MILLVRDAFRQYQPGKLCWHGSGRESRSVATTMLNFVQLELLTRRAKLFRPLEPDLCAKASPGAGHRCAPFGWRQQALCKVAFAGVGRAAVGASRVVCAPLWVSWHRGIGQALRALWSVSGLRPVMWCVPPPTLVLRRCAASALRAGLPVRPPRGLPQPTSLSCWLCYNCSSCPHKEYGAYRPKQPVSQRDRWLTFQVQSSFRSLGPF